MKIIIKMIYKKLFINSCFINVHTWHENIEANSKMIDNFFISTSYLFLFSRLINEDNVAIKYFDLFYIYCFTCTFFLNIRFRCNIRYNIVNIKQNRDIYHQRIFLFHREDISTHIKWASERFWVDLRKLLSTYGTLK